MVDFARARSSTARFLCKAFHRYNAEGIFPPWPSEDDYLIDVSPAQFYSMGPYGFLAIYCGKTGQRVLEFSKDYTPGRWHEEIYFSDMDEMVARAYGFPYVSIQGMTHPTPNPLYGSSPEEIIMMEDMDFNGRG